MGNFIGSQVTTLGEVVERVDRFCIEWTIKDFFSIPSEVDEPVCSPPFSFADVRWRLLMYPKGQTSKNSTGSIDLYLGRRSSGPPIEVNFFFGVKKSNKEIAKQRHYIFNFKEQFDGYGTWNYLKQSKLLERKSEYAPSDCLTIVCRMKYPDAPSALKKFSFLEIRGATKSFAHELGRGGFGAVYKGEIDGNVIAAKLFLGVDEKFITEEFIVEFKTLASFKHRFLLSIIGYCDDPAHPALVLDYMVNGSLEDRLACKGNTKPLPWDIRFVIAYCSTLGLSHLHSAGQVHRDIKSGNILLDEDFFPKVADFGLVRIGESGDSTIIQVTLNVCGTPVYMAPESFDGDVSIKLDTFSFGVVLLELLTGLPAYHDGKRLQHYSNKIMNMLDSKAHWDKVVAKGVYEIAKRCLVKSKKERPTISQITADLKAILPTNHSTLRMLIKDLSYSS